MIMMASLPLELTHSNRESWNLFFDALLFDDYELVTRVWLFWHWFVTTYPICHWTPDAYSIIFQLMDITISSDLTEIWWHFWIAFWSLWLRLWSRIGNVFWNGLTMIWITGLINNALQYWLVNGPLKWIAIRFWIYGNCFETNYYPDASFGSWYQFLPASKLFVRKRLSTSNYFSYPNYFHSC